jgi:ADP-L-glycero-D-manno-heptose 6-epimerase
MINKDSVIIVTGAAGFIGSCMVGYLNQCGFNNLILVDDFDSSDKTLNWQNKRYLKLVERKKLFHWLDANRIDLKIFIHLGARTDTTEFDYLIHRELNLEYSKSAWLYCAQKGIPLIYASSAATYGSGEQGYDDNHDKICSLEPLNPYAISKNEFDKWALVQPIKPPCWIGLKFFNVYGPNEYHKEKMASVIWHSFNQIQETGEVNLFKSYRPDFEDGQQLRDFVYVKDLLSVMYWIIESIISSKWGLNKNGLYNVGTGQARSFFDLVNVVFKSLNEKPKVNFIDMPEHIRDRYQYYTSANINKLRNAGYINPFFSIEEGIDDYVKNYLLKNKVY